MNTHNERSAKITGTERGNYGLKIAKPSIGKHVWEISDPKEYNFTSALGVLGLLKVVDYKGVTNASGAIDLTFNHDIGYAPLIIATTVTYDDEVVTINPTEWHSGYVTLPDRTFIEVVENFNFKFDENTFTMEVSAYETDNMMGGYFAYLSGRTYIFRVYYYFNEITDE